jgi:hypothetical protein
MKQKLLAIRIKSIRGRERLESRRPTWMG